MAANNVEFKGQIIGGRAHSRAVIERYLSDIKALIGDTVFPGSLNVILKKPIMLDNRSALRFGDGLRLVWPAKINGLEVWLFRWQTAPLHIVEVLSPLYLRKYLSLMDNDNVIIAIEANHLDKVSMLGKIAWTLCWSGRRNWCYTNDKYFFWTMPICRRLGATQLGLADSAIDILKNFLKRRLGS